MKFDFMKLFVIFAALGLSNLSAALVPSDEIRVVSPAQDTIVAQTDDKDKDKDDDKKKKK